MSFESEPRMPPNIESFNSDELEAPTWMDAQYFTEILRQHEHDQELEVIALKLTPASGKGDHYASIMFRASLQYKTKRGKSSKSLIIKTMPEKEGHKKDLLSQSHIFETEINMYSEMLPRFEETLCKTGDETKLFVPCIYHSLKPRQVMIFEDLVQQGYVVKRDREPNNEEIRSAYSKLGKWHAVSYALAKQQPALLENYKYSLMELPGINKDPLMSTGLEFFIKLLDSIPDLKVYKPYFERMRPNFMRRVIDSFKEYRENPVEDAYYVLCHGDFHLRNLMFKYNKAGELTEDCMLLDFQMSNVGPMPLDIIYSIYNMLSPEQRQNQRDEFIYFYFSTFRDTLKKINYEGTFPTLVEFRQQFYRHRYLGKQCARGLSCFNYSLSTSNRVLPIDNIYASDDCTEDRRVRDR